MQFLVVAVFVGCIAFAAAGLTDEQHANLKQAEKDCIQESGVAEDVVKKTEEGVFAEDQKLTDFYVCFFKKPGFINDAGEYQIEAIKMMITQKYDEPTADKFLAACAKETKGNAKENALQMGKCYHENVTKDKH